MYVAKRLGRNQVRTADEVAAGFLELQEGGVSREDVALEGLVSALTTLIAARDPYTALHANDVEYVAVQLAMAMNLSPDQINLVRLVGKLHDVGKVAIADAILLKPGPLNSEEWARMRQHPIIGAEVVKRVPTLRALAPSIRSHHERWDGTGYPDGLIGDSIPMAALIVAVADAYSAMTSDRPYRPAQSPEWAAEQLRAGSGTQFAPHVIAALDEALRLLKAA
jgi:two-component system cell cycle response regulator